MVAADPARGLSRVLRDLGATLLEVVGRLPQEDVAVSDVLIHDPLDDPSPLSAGALVLGVGVSEPQELATLLIQLGLSGAAALVVRTPVRASGIVVSAVETSGVALLGLARGASWTQAAELIRRVLTADAEADPDLGIVDDGPAPDLFTLANAVAALLDAPVTIEDRASRVLAFSEGQHEADRSRIETVLGRQVPEAYTRMLQERGVFQRLYRQEQPVDIDPEVVSGDAMALPRVAIAIRAGDEVLGSIWAAVQRPMSADRREAMVDASKVVAMQMLRMQAREDTRQRIRSNLVAAALQAGPTAARALRRLGLLDHPVCVMAVAQADPSGELHALQAGARLLAAQQRVLDALGVHLLTVRPAAALALLGEVVYAILPEPPGTSDVAVRAREAAESFVERTTARQPLLVGIGPVVQAASGLGPSRSGADRVLRVLQRGPRAPRVAGPADVWGDALLLELGDLMAANGEAPSGPVSRLAAYDRAHQTQLVSTLERWLDCFGNVGAAAESLFIHPNTFRYRLRRVSEVGLLRLNDADARFAAMLELRLMTDTGVPPPGTGHGTVR